MSETIRPMTMQDILDDPDLFAQPGQRKAGSRYRATQAVYSAICQGWERLDPAPRGVRTDSPEYQAWRDRKFARQKMPDKVTVAEFVRIVDEMAMHRAKGCGPVILEEVRRGLEKHGYRLVVDLTKEVREDAPMTRDALVARVSDVLRRSGVPDAEVLAREIEARIPPGDRPATPQDDRFPPRHWEPRWVTVPDSDASASFKPEG